MINYNFIPQMQNINQSQPNEQKAVKRPYVGVVSVPFITQTPVEDTLYLNRKENPKVEYYIKKKPLAVSNYIATIGIFISSLILVIGHKIKSKK